jgi:hypothetical protein
MYRCKMVILVVLVAGCSLVEPGDGTTLAGSWNDLAGLPHMCPV